MLDAQSSDGATLSLYILVPATFFNFGPTCPAIFLLWSGEINQLELFILLDIYVAKF